jgi:hypothetical protein
VGPEVKGKPVKRLVLRCLLKGYFWRLFDATKKCLDNAVPRAPNTNIASTPDSARRFLFKLIERHQ